LKLDGAPTFLRKPVPYPSLYALPVLWYDRLEKSFVAGQVFLWLPENPKELIGPIYLIGFDIPVPITNVSKALRSLQGFLYPAALADFLLQFVVGCPKLGRTR
jgi:hypothetical protein